MEVSSADFPVPEANVTDDGMIMHRQRTSASQRCTIFRVLCFISFSCFLLHIVICYLLAAGSAPLNERDPSVQLPIVSRYPHKDGGPEECCGGSWAVDRNSGGGRPDRSLQSDRKNSGPSIIDFAVCLMPVLPHGFYCGPRAPIREAVSFGLHLLS